MYFLFWDLWIVYILLMVRLMESLLISCSSISTLNLNKSARTNSCFLLVQFGTIAIVFFSSAVLENSFSFLFLSFFVFNFSFLVLFFIHNNWLCSRKTYPQFWKIFFWRRGEGGFFEWSLSYKCGWTILLFFQQEKKSFLGMFLFWCSFFHSNVNRKNIFKNIDRYFVNKKFLCLFGKEGFPWRVILKSDKAISFQSLMSNPAQSDQKKIVPSQDVLFV